MNLRKWLFLLVVVSLMSFVSAGDKQMLDQEAEHRKEVMHHLIMIPDQETVFDFISFQLHGPDVILIGFTVRPIIKTDSERAVKRIKWVRNVENQIQVLPIQPAAREIRAQTLAILERMIPTAFAQNHANFRIKVLDSNVTLYGYVSEIDKVRLEAAINQIKHVPLVKAVVNNVVVRPKK